MFGDHINLFGHAVTVGN